MSMKVVVAASIVLAALGAAGCHAKDDGGSAGSKAAVLSAKDSAISVLPIDEAGLKELIKERHGRILLVNIWATWCAPCVEEFPDLVRLSQTYVRGGFDLVAISADYPDEVDSKIVPFLKKQNVPFRVFVAKFDHQEDFINAVNQSWNGALPATLIYNAQGKQRLFHIGQLTYEQFKDSIEKVKGGL